MRRFAPLLLALCLVAAGAVPPAAAHPATNSPETTALEAGPSAATSNAVAPSGATPDAAASNPAAAQSPTNNSTTLTILSYNDVQTAAVQNGTLPRMVTLLNQRRAAHDNPTVVVGGGDEVSPHSLSPLSQWQVPVDVLNVVDPAAEVIGNHDLDYGFGPVANFSDASAFPWLMANVVDSETGEPVPGTKPYTVVERGGVTVGIVGLADEAIESKTAVDFDEQGYEVRNFSEVASEYATTLKQEQNVDVVVAAAHVGIPEAQTLANQTENVDAIAVGDDEVEYPPAETGGAVIMEAEGRAEHVAELNLTVSDGEVTEWDGRLLDVTENVSKNETVDGLVTEARADELDTVAGRTEVELDARFSPNYHDETAIGNVITDAFRAKTGAEVAITNAGGIRSNSVYGPGNVTVGDVYNVLPFQNTLVTVELTGAQLKRLLASQVVALESETGQQYGAEAQLQVSGVTYEWVGHNDTDRQIRDAWVNGDPVSDDATYDVTVNSYMAGWDDSVFENATVVSESSTLYGTALLEYVQQNSPIAPADENRIRRIDAEVQTESVEATESEVTVTLAAPEGVQNVSDAFRAVNGDNSRTATGSATLSGDTVEVTFDRSDLQSVTAGETVQLYGGYNTSAYQRVYFEHSVLNAEVPTDEFAAETTTATETTTAGETETTTATERAVEDETTTTESESGASIPGFTPVTVVVALVAAALLALRRT